MRVRGTLNKVYNIGFIGAGIMGQGMVENLLKAGHNLNIIANKNRRPIDRLVSLGATEVKSLVDLSKCCDHFIFCLPDSQTVKSICTRLFPFLAPKTIIIDCSTNEVVTVKELERKAKSAKLCYIEAPLTGGKQQAQEATLGAIVGCDIDDFSKVTNILEPCCAQIERLGNVGMGATTKLISNFLALGTATLVVEALKVAKNHGVDWQKFYKLASQGSGHSMSLDRIAPPAIKGTHDGYVFTIENTLKDMEYIADLIKDQPDAVAITEIFLKIYKKAKSAGMQKALLSERLQTK